MCVSEREGGREGGVCVCVCVCVWVGEGVSEGGIGENDAELRGAVLDGLSTLGITLDR